MTYPLSHKLAALSSVPRNGQFVIIELLRSNSNGQLSLIGSYAFYYVAMTV